MNIERMKNLENERIEIEKIIEEKEQTIKDIVQTINKERDEIFGHNHYDSSDISNQFEANIQEAVTDFSKLLQDRIPEKEASLLVTRTYQQIGEAVIQLNKLESNNDFFEIRPSFNEVQIYTNMDYLLVAEFLNEPLLSNYSYDDMWEKMINMEKETTFQFFEFFSFKEKEEIIQKINEDFKERGKLYRETLSFLKELKALKGEIENLTKKAMKGIIDCPEFAKYENILLAYLGEADVPFEF